MNHLTRALVKSLPQLFIRASSLTNAHEPRYLEMRMFTVCSLPFLTSHSSAEVLAHAMDTTSLSNTNGRRTLYPATRPHCRQGRYRNCFVFGGSLSAWCMRLLVLAGARNKTAWGLKKMKVASNVSWLVERGRLRYKEVEKRM